MGDGPLIDRKVFAVEGRHYLVLTLAEALLIKREEPHRLILVNGEWCVETSHE